MAEILPADYAERVYAGVLGKIIGVYLGRPFEGWTYEQIAAQLGDIDYYVHDKVGVPLLVTDDDISGTFTFLRALPDHGNSLELTAEQIGQTWLNYIIESRSILWWGGLGNSTEHTAYLRLKNGIPAPRSGSIELNGQVVAEQIGAQIFIDGWAMVAPGQPELAAELARRAGSVSHDGVAVHAAQLLAAMEAQAFLTDDIDALIDVGLKAIPADSLIAGMIGDIRTWHKEEPDWRRARAMLEEKYGYHIYGGNCHVVPNHGLIILALLYGGGDWDRSMMIVNTCGWDTDCNSGNLGALLGIRGGLAAFEGERDWRGPVADRLYLPTADPGRAISDAATEAWYVVDSGRALAGLPPEKPPARFHFTFPGSVQGFTSDSAEVSNVDGRLHIVATGPALVTTPTFTPPEAIGMRGYQLMAAPTLYPGQRVRARVSAERRVSAGLVATRYGADDELVPMAAQERVIGPEPVELSWIVPQTGGQPVAQVGLEVRGAGTLHLDWLTWDGEPDIVLTRPLDGGTMWQRCWADAMDQFEIRGDEPYRLIQNAGRGLVLHGTRDWRDYVLTTTLTPHLAAEAGVAVRAQGLRRYYALLLSPAGARLVRMLDEETTLAQAPLEWQLGRAYDVRLAVTGSRLEATVDGRPLLTAEDSALTGGGIALVCTEGRVAAGPVHVTPA